MKKILIITTGGTIACETTENGRVPSRSGEQLTAGITGCRIEICDLFSCDSTDITPEHWCKLYNKVRESADYDGIVILHGTDTLEYTAAMLYFTASDMGVPVILTGAMIPMSEPDSDGGRNIRDAVTAACDGRLSGVYVAFSGRIISGGNVIKRYSAENDAFRAFCGKDNGIVQDGAVADFCRAEQPVNLKLPERDKKISVIKLSPFTDSLYVPENCDGAVIESYGAGGISSHLTDSLSALCLRMPVIITTSCGGGADLYEYEVGQRALSLGVIDGGRMSTACAAVKMWLEL